MVSKGQIFFLSSTCNFLPTFRHTLWGSHSQVFFWIIDPWRSCLLHVSNILCLSSGRLYCTCSLICYVFHVFM